MQKLGVYQMSMSNYVMHVTMKCGKAEINEKKVVYKQALISTKYIDIQITLHRANQTANADLRLLYC